MHVILDLVPGHTSIEHPWFKASLSPEENEFSHRYIWTDKAWKGFENVGNIEVAKLEKGLTIMATIAGGAPMIGFLGTVTGMVRAFFEMANAGNNIDITLLSGGIYEAMITTVGGLIVGIIAMFAYNYLVTLVDGVVNKMEAKTMAFMDLLNEPAR